MAGFWSGFGDQFARSYEARRTRDWRTDEAEKEREWQDEQFYKELEANRKNAILESLMVKGLSGAGSSGSGGSGKSTGITANDIAAAEAIVSRFPNLDPEVVTEISTQPGAATLILDKIQEFEDENDTRINPQQGKQFIGTIYSYAQDGAEVDEELMNTTFAMAGIDGSEPLYEGSDMTYEEAYRNAAANREGARGYRVDFDYSALDEPLTASEMKSYKDQVRASVLPRLEYEIATIREEMKIAEGERREQLQKQLEMKKLQKNEVQNGNMTPEITTQYGLDEIVSIATQDDRIFELFPDAREYLMSSEQAAILEDVTPNLPDYNPQGVAPSGQEVVAKFSSMEEAQAAYDAGTIDIGDYIEINGRIDMVD